MKSNALLCGLHLFVILDVIHGQHKINMSQVSPKRDNPSFVRDRKITIINKPEMPTTWSQQHRQPFDEAWMDYCDPYHCNDYHKIACGLNRRNMKFRWFQSVCHLIINNQCAPFRGTLKYDLIDNKYCHAYVMFLRAGCPTECEEDVDPVCAMSAVDGHVVIFKNECSLEARNCRNETLQEYDLVFMAICELTVATRRYI